ncbi:hypothetical protein BH09ACT8_BH09ACT8_15630 [soil metagenome]
MPRLPVPGGDNGNWGTILNDYLSQVHMSDGTLKNNSVGSAQIANQSVSLAKLVDVGTAGGIAIVDDDGDVINTHGTKLLDREAARAMYSPKLDVFFASEFCAEDGVTDDGPALVALFNDLVAANGGTLIFTPGKSYLINTTIDVDVTGIHLDIIGNGAKLLGGDAVLRVLYIHGSMTQLTGGDDAYLQTAVGHTALTTTQDVSGYVVAGDELMIWSSDLDNPERTTYMSGELIGVTSATSSSITLDRKIILTHTSGATRRLYKMAFSKSIRITDLVVIASNAVAQGLIRVENAANITVSAVKASGKNADYGVHIRNSRNVLIENVELVDIYDAAATSSNNVDGPGIVLVGCVGAVVRRVRSVRCRHAVDVSTASSLDLPGLISLNIAVEDSHAIHAWAPPFTTHHARNVVFNRCVAEDSGGGFFQRAIGWTMRDCTVIGGHADKPPEWVDNRTLPSALAIGESNLLPNGQGYAGSRVTIDNFTSKNLPSDWSRITWSDLPGSEVSISGPDVVVAPGVLISDSGNRADGSAGSADLAYGGLMQLTWNATSSGFAIVSSKFGRTGSGGTGNVATLSTDFAADIEVSATWNVIGSNTNGSALYCRGSSASSNPDAYFLSVAATGTPLLVKRVSGTTTTLATGANGSVVAGDRIALRVIGRHLQALVNGKIALEVDDTSIPSSGRIGFWFRGSVGDGWAASKFVVKSII